MSKLPYDKPTPVKWHGGDERFYSGGYDEYDYVLVPVKQYQALCEHKEVFRAFGKTSDLGSYTYPHGSEQGYVPHIPGIMGKSGGDYLDINICMSCGVVIGLDLELLNARAQMVEAAGYIKVHDNGGRGHRWFFCDGMMLGGTYEQPTSDWHFYGMTKDEVSAEIGRDGDEFYIQIDGGEQVKFSGLDTLKKGIEIAFAQYLEEEE